MIIHDYTQILKCQKRGANYLEKAHYENHMKMGNKNQNWYFTSNKPPVELDNLTLIYMIQEYFSDMEDEVSYCITYFIFRKRTHIAYYLHQLTMT